HFIPHKNELCGDCQTRLEQNPMRILDCKTDKDHPAMKTAPSVLDYLNEDSRTYFEKVKTYLSLMNIDYEVDPNLVRGLDYYNHTAFEIMSKAEGFGAITTLAGGGRYNGLIEELGGPETPGLGFGMGLERLMMAVEAENIEITAGEALYCFFVAVSDQAEKASVQIVYDLRKSGIQIDRDYQSRKIKAQFKAADRYRAKYVLVLGENELEQQTINVKEMATVDEAEVSLAELSEFMRGKLSGGKTNE